MNKILLCESIEDNIKIIENYVEELENYQITNVVTHDEVIEQATNIKPDIVLLSSQNTSQEFILDTVTTLANSGIKTIVMASNYSTNQLIKTLRCGASDFLSLPIIKDNLISALNKVGKTSLKGTKSNIISIYSNKGGIGKTAIATNLAVEFARQTREKVVLVDLNLPLGDVTTFVNIRPNMSLLSAIENAEHNGAEAIMDACIQYKDSSLYVLAEPMYMEENLNLGPKHILKLFEFLRANFAYIIVDMGTNVEKINMKTLELSDLILLVSIVNLPLIRNCQRCLDLFSNLGFDESKTKIIVNRYLENDEIKIEDVEKVLNQSIYWKIPNNYFTIMSSINKAMPVSELNENSNITLSFSGLTTKLIEDIIAKDIIKF